jgi:hypothetical protein
VISCLLKNEPASSSQKAVKVKSLCGGAEAKASLKRATRSLRADPKPSELTVGRVRSR